MRRPHTATTKVGERVHGCWVFDAGLAKLEGGGGTGRTCPGRAAVVRHDVVRDVGLGAEAHAAPRLAVCGHLRELREDAPDDGRAED